MSLIKFNVCGAELEYELHDLGKSESLRVNGELIVDFFGDVGAWGEDYHKMVHGLHGAAKAVVEERYLKDRAQNLLISAIFALRDQVNELSE